MLLTWVLSKLIKIGSMVVIDAEGVVHRFDGAKPGPAVTIRLHDRSLHSALVRNPYLKIGESYMNGSLTIERGTLGEFLELCCMNVQNAAGNPVIMLTDWLGNRLRWLQQFNPVPRSRRNVAHHYDLSDTLYQLFLDTDRQYSCAYFMDDDESLESAQLNKKRHIASKLLLAPGLKTLDIGCGWGGLALYLAQASQCEVTGITLSEEQYRVARERAARSECAAQVEFRLTDYRQMTGTFDRIVSVGMFEHVGAVYYRRFFAKVREMLADDGVCLLHSIGRMEPPGNTNRWLRKYIFPGGYSPAMSEVLAAIEREGLYVTDIEILRLHYAKTLSHWYDRFTANRERVLEIYDERFYRMWEFYLKGCEVAFKHWNQMVFQMQIAKRQDAVPLTRDYMLDWERAQREKDTGTRSDIAA